VTPAATEPSAAAGPMTVTVSPVASDATSDWVVFETVVLDVVVTLTVLPSDVVIVRVEPSIDVIFPAVRPP